MYNFFKLFIPLLLLICLSSDNLLSQTDKGDHQKYSQVRIFAISPSDFQKIQNAGLYLEGGIYKTGLFYETVLSEKEISMLRKSGVRYEITIDNWENYYQNLPKMSNLEIQNAIHQAMVKDNVSHSIYGSMGGFLKYSEVVAKMDSMRLQYPNLISVKFSIGNTIENRTQWCARVTHNPDAPTGRPEVLMHAAIHAREPEGMETQVYFMYWLFENYNIDPLATFILNNREIYWIPIFNIDGYVYNETTNKWRRYVEV